MLPTGALSDAELPVTSNMSPRQHVDLFAIEVRYRFTLTAVRPCSAMKLVIQFLGSHSAALCAAPSPPDRSRENADLPFAG
jgi:hypothetical protein